MALCPRVAPRRLSNSRGQQTGPAGAHAAGVPDTHSMVDRGRDAGVRPHRVARRGIDGLHRVPAAHDYVSSWQPARNRCTHTARKIGAGAGKQSGFCACTPPTAAGPDDVGASDGWNTVRFRLYGRFLRRQTLMTVRPKSTDGYQPGSNVALALCTRKPCGRERLPGKPRRRDSSTAACFCPLAGTAGAAVAATRGPQCWASARSASPAAWGRGTGTGAGHKGTQQPR